MRVVMKTLNTTFYSSLDKKFGENDDRIGVGYLYQKRNITPNNGLPTAQGLTLLGLPNDDFYGAKWNDFNNESHDVFVDSLYQLPSKGIVSAGIRYSDRKRIIIMRLQVQHWITTADLRQQGWGRLSKKMPCLRILI